jgi:hypothetical protein
MSFNSKWFISDIHGWKTKPETEPDTKPETETENRGWKTIPNPKPQDPKPAGIRPEPDPLSSLVQRTTRIAGFQDPRPLSTCVKKKK